MLKYRLISGPTVAALFLLPVFFLPSLATWLMAMALAARLQYEFYRMLDRSGTPVFNVIGMLSGAALLSVTFWTSGHAAGTANSIYQWESIVLVVTLMVIFVRLFPQKNNSQPIATAGCTLLGIWYIPFMLGFFTRLGFCYEQASALERVGRTGQLLVVYMVVVVKSTDIGAYFTGRSLGRHKLFPRLSPKKTIEGLVGGLATAVLVSLAFSIAGGGTLGSVHLGVPRAIVLGLLLGVAGVIGDLFESLLKRACNVKDSGRIVPGMGGLLDVFDSLLFGAPVLYLYLSVANS